MWNEMRIILLNFASVCKREKVYLFRNGNWKFNLEIEVTSRSSTCLESRADCYNRSWKWANMPFFKDTYFLLRKVFKVSIGQKVQHFAELPSDRPVQHFLSDPCAHGVRSLGRNVCPSVTEFVKTFSEDCQCSQCWPQLMTLVEDPSWWPLVEDLVEDIAYVTMMADWIC